MRLEHRGGRGGSGSTWLALASVARVPQAPRPAPLSAGLMSPSLPVSAPHRGLETGVTATQQDGEPRAIHAPEGILPLAADAQEWVHTSLLLDGETEAPGGEGNSGALSGSLERPASFQGPLSNPHKPDV